MFYQHCGNNFICFYVISVAASKNISSAFLPEKTLGIQSIRCRVGDANLFPPRMNGDAWVSPGRGTPHLTDAGVVFAQRLGLSYFILGGW